MYTLKKTEMHARLGEFKTPHGTIKLPGFMNVATCGAIKGGVSAIDLKELNCQVQLCNTYHLHLRPGDEIVKAMGGVRKFTSWDGPVLTDSGGFQVFSLAALRKISEEGVIFSSHVNGQRIFMGPEESMRIQSNLASTIAMAFDECISYPSDYAYTKASCDRTVRWLERCKVEMQNLNSMEDTLNKQQMLFGINQGSTYKDIRIENMDIIREFDLDGYAIGGLAVGETTEKMYEIIEDVEPHMPKDKPRYLMGVGTPRNILEAVARGIDLMDCVMPSRNARHGKIFTWNGPINIYNAKHKCDDLPIDENCCCPTCKNHSRGYIHHLFKSDELLGMRLAVMHNLYFYNSLFARIRSALEEGAFEQFYNHYRTVF